MNKAEIHKAFRKRPTSFILYVFGSQGGRIRDEDVIAFNALHKAYEFNLESLVFIINEAPKNRPKDYEGEVIVLLEKLIRMSCKTLCVLESINKNNPYERKTLKEKLFQAIIERMPELHEKKQEIELQLDRVHQAQKEIKALQKAFRENKRMYEEKIKVQQNKYDAMFAQIHTENENMKRFIEQQAEARRRLQNQMTEQDAAHKENEKQRDQQHRSEMRKIKKEYKRAMKKANEEAAKQPALLQRPGKLKYACYTSSVNNTRRYLYIFAQTNIIFSPSWKNFQRKFWRD
jgi:septal ring factor EnvC (AmiA/AmiB activator)